MEDIWDWLGRCSDETVIREATEGHSLTFQEESGKIMEQHRSRGMPHTLTEEENTWLRNASQKPREVLPLQAMHTNQRNTPQSRCPKLISTTQPNRREVHDSSSHPASAQILERRLSVIINQKEDRRATVGNRLDVERNTKLNTSLTQEGILSWYDQIPDISKENLVPQQRIQENYRDTRAEIVHHPQSDGRRFACRIDGMIHAMSLRLKRTNKPRRNFCEEPANTILRAEFINNQSPTAEQIERLSKLIGKDKEFVRQWFQNRRIWFKQTLDYAAVHGTLNSTAAAVPTSNSSSFRSTNMDTRNLVNYGRPASGQSSYTHSLAKIVTSPSWDDGVPSRNLSAPLQNPSNCTCSNYIQMKPQNDQ